MSKEVQRIALDRFLPVYQFNEVHSLRIQASCEQVYRAIKSVTAGEIRFFRTLTWIRRFGRPGPEGILNPPRHEPILDVAVRTSFLLLADAPDKEIVLGSVVASPPGSRLRSRLTAEEFRSFDKPGFTLAALNFLIKDAGSGACTVTTETRVYATDASAQRRFARYWRVIYPGSALIRRMWLRAIARRAETGR